ncbi:spermidine/putrescine ABC transporter ATP-binding protein [Roseobacter denitrificans]|uniref:Spermidine/putrescine import ATP-binding protein PotA n=1 Tax=Roseobacter denitrificans (strain ATCC 33942 / OCh 114) TaxID=375451 RepID=POTA_ROSDO|nr:ABC transporter ATP-binding protein [Roseobacter denitrificans]Q160M2.1 RecName: Full=Spermidine/putrescine import ATP-binding protein PotA [Roseobacter denitrificans OCh 114]ABG33571.1 polyamine ABC transporter, ATP-binding component, putative [Roseobacter denitrificans OCh 114]AVL52877.1 spermidine/putrescine ABC transporter ATP-binding protein [Roseobacter denitrificans]SFG04234.1 spermidine/putrescine transport system ATP-binding protein [Roseobacter denitrificans OCh 114]
MSHEVPNAIDVRNAVKRYGDFTALKTISLSIRDNEFFTLLGPSGCGKTTLLRMIAGFEDVTEGEIFLYGEEIEDLPPNRRPVNTVFQNYALFPHMDVMENVGFGLEMLGKPKAQARARAGEILELVQLSQFANRKPSQLSGGQQQRVALARALAPQPKVLLLDEPLSALDLKLRKAMQLELKHLQRETGITFIFVTHDQDEALTMSDRIAVMSAGELQQLGDARDIYEKPANRFVADFIGETNLFEVTIKSRDGTRVLCAFLNGLTLTCDAVAGMDVGDRVHMSIRPERIKLRSSKVETENFQAQVVENIYAGTDVQTIVHLQGGMPLAVRTQNSEIGRSMTFEPGAEVFVDVEFGSARLLAN